MEDSVKESLKQIIRQWINDRHQALLEQVMMTWQEGMGRLNPDAALMEELAALATPEPPLLETPQDMETEFAAGLDLLERAGSQGEVLKHLLEGLMPFVERSALFVIKQGIASLYACRGFESESPRLGTPLVPPPELESLMLGRTSRIGEAGPAYMALLAPLSRFEASGVLIQPLNLRRKTVAILLVDSGLRQVIDHPSHVRALAHSAESRLSYLAGMKEDERTASPVVSPSTLTQRIPEAIAEPTIPILDPKIRSNAERSARVLVGDIELYFPAKVAQGRQQGNLYAVLRDELERSRASFIDRYGADLEQTHKIFLNTILGQLCEGNPSRLGHAPWA
jgi:hypothetical protein